MASKKIFISYSRNDTEYVSALVQAFRTQGFDVWFDKNIITGNDWDDTIEEQIKAADAVVLILSKTSVESENVKDEMSYAIGLGKSVNPIKIEECVIPMRLARKQFLDFTKMGHEAGFERLVKDINTHLADRNAAAVPRGTFVPPVTKHFTYQKSAPRSSNSLLYIIGGIAVGGTVVVFFIIFLVALFTPNSVDEENPKPYSQVETKEEADWNLAYEKNNLDGYLGYLYTYGKPAKYYANAYTEINNFLPNTATVWYGVKNGEIHFSKYLYYSGDQTTPPQYDDIITPLFKSELYEGTDYVRNGVFVQPGQKLLVRDVWVDTNNNIWAGVQYDRSLASSSNSQ